MSWWNPFEHKSLSGAELAKRMDDLTLEKMFTFRLGEFTSQGESNRSQGIAELVQLGEEVRRRPFVSFKEGQESLYSGYKTKYYNQHGRG